MEIFHLTVWVFFYTQAFLGQLKPTCFTFQILIPKANWQKWTQQFWFHAFLEKWHLTGTSNFHQFFLVRRATLTELTVVQSQKSEDTVVKL